MCVSLIKICQVVFKYQALKFLKVYKIYEIYNSNIINSETCKCTIVSTMCSICVKEHMLCGIQV